MPRSTEASGPIPNFSMTPTLVPTSWIRARRAPLACLSPGDVGPAWAAVDRSRRGPSHPCHCRPVSRCGCVAMGDPARPAHGMPHSSPLPDQVERSDGSGVRRMSGRPCEIARSAGFLPTPLPPCPGARGAASARDPGAVLRLAWDPDSWRSATRGPSTRSARSAHVLGEGDPARCVHRARSPGASPPLRDPAGRKGSVRKRGGGAVCPVRDPKRVGVRLAGLGWPSSATRCVTGDPSTCARSGSANSAGVRAATGLFQTPAHPALTPWSRTPRSR